MIASVTQPFCGDCTPRAHLGGGAALHLPVRGARPRPARAAPLRRDDDELRDAIAGRWRAPRRPLLGAALRADVRPQEGRDVLHRRLARRQQRGELGARARPDEARRRSRRGAPSAVASTRRRHARPRETRTRRRRRPSRARAPDRPAGRAPVGCTPRASRTSGPQSTPCRLQRARRGSQKAGTPARARSAPTPRPARPPVRLRPATHLDRPAAGERR